MADEAKKTSKKVDELVDEVSKLTVLELSDLVGALQEKLGVTAMPVAQAAPAAAPTEAGAPGGAPTAAATQTVIMTASGDNKIGVIKALREINQNFSLMEAKGMTETLPAEVVKDAKAEDAKVAVEKLKAAGATVEVK
ncbi:50S ribosomal protein L7/L12 [Candidatus Woesebacteria bacterium]|nr:50S ribosomal protein L7/L12 [Candidatus Woesebacteria bacterium]